MTKNKDNNGKTIILDRPAPKKTARGSYRMIAEREAAEEAAKDAASTKATRNRDKLRKTEAMVAKRAKEKAAKEKAEAKATAKKIKAAEAKASKLAKKIMSDEAKFADHARRADIEAGGSEATAVKNAVVARKLFAERVLMLKDREAHLLLNVSGMGVTLPRFSEGVRLLAVHKGFHPDANGMLPEREFSVCRAVYNTANGKLNELMAKIDKAKSTKFTITASPKSKKAERSATLAKRTKVNLDALKACKAMTLEGWNSLLLVCDTSAKILDVAASRLVNDAAKYVAAGSGAVGKLGRHLSNLRKNSTLVRPSYASTETLEKINLKGKEALKAVEIHPLLLADASAAILAAKTSVIAPEPVKTGKAKVKVA